jgi:hypothetical protein
VTSSTGTPTLRAMGSDLSDSAALTATAYWTVGPGAGELRSHPLPPGAPSATQALVRTVCSGVSRGTELLVHAGAVPPEVRQLMRAPFQEGDLPGPVKYGYLSVGQVEAGPDELVGQRVFCLYPHQDRYLVPVSALTRLPAGVPSDRAVLTGTVETAINAVWDAAPRLGDRVAVVGAGMVGCALAGVLRRFPLSRLELVDVDVSRTAVAHRFGIGFAVPQDAAPDCDLVFHCSASGAGLNRGLELLGEEGELIELSWFGDRAVAATLGGAFHARRLTVRASQVGAVAAARRARRTHADRRELAVDTLRDPAFDELITSRGPFSQLPDTIRQLASGELTGLCHVVEYETSGFQVHRVDEEV